MSGFLWTGNTAEKLFCCWNKSSLFIFMFFVISTEVEVQTVDVLVINLPLIGLLPASVELCPEEVLQRTGWHSISKSLTWFWQWMFISKPLLSFCRIMQFTPTLALFFSWQCPGVKLCFLETLQPSNLFALTDLFSAVSSSYHSLCLVLCLVNQYLEICWCMLKRVDVTVCRR